LDFFLLPLNRAFNISLLRIFGIFRVNGFCIATTRKTRSSTSDQKTNNHYGQTPSDVCVDHTSPLGSKFFVGDLSVSTAQRCKHDDFNNIFSEFRSKIPLNHQADPRFLLPRLRRGSQVSSKGRSEILWLTLCCITLPVSRGGSL